MKYIAILRGINVGGHRKILMADLKLLLGELGLTNITTYIQSGNVLFEAKETNVKIECAIANAILAKYGFEVPVIVISVELFAKLPKLNPYLNTISLEKLHVTFLKELPSKENLQHMAGFDYAPDIFEIMEQVVFLAIEDKYHKSKLSNNFFEKQLKVNATTRNWKTVTKLIELSQK